MFSEIVEYALRAAVHLAFHAPTPQTTEQIAQATRVKSPTYLAKVLQSMRRAGIVRSQRGSGGGIRLARETDQLTILDIVNAVEPIQRINYCPLGIKAHGKRLCPLHNRVDLALASVEQAFASTTLAEVLAEPTESYPLCDPPRP